LQVQAGAHSTAVWRSPFNFDVELNNDPQEDDPRLSSFFEAAQKEAEGTGGSTGPGYAQALACRMKAILKAKYGIDVEDDFRNEPWTSPRLKTDRWIAHETSATSD
jgi:hypothetical protein